MSNLKVFNTLTGTKDEFAPLSPGKVLMYACGPTVYDLSHLGHARAAINPDIIQRYLRYLGYDVTYVRNITDVEDKIIKRARERGLRPDQIARQFTYTYWHDMHALNVSIPDAEPRATEFVSRMILFIEGLIAKGHAYVSGSDVYFDVTSYKDYGKLKKQSLDEMQSGARDQVRSQEELSEAKRNPFDFALWKSVPAAETGWDSPWGWGRPGWHLECSTMIKHVLGETIDIHAGGEDLVFPHHENEIAQSEALHGKPFARYWLHHSFVRIDAAKMSKSLGNFTTIADLLQSYTPDMVRVFLLQTHYRCPIEFSVESMDAVRAATQRLMRASQRFIPDKKSEKLPDGIATDLAAAETQFKEAMNNDFNTPQACAVLFSVSDKALAADDPLVASAFAGHLRHLGGVLGLTFEDRSQEVGGDAAKGLISLILELRDSARTNKDYAASDLIRDRLLALGIKVMDVKGGPATWERS
jgi:cysteinyl-tRNA synthetase